MKNFAKILLAGGLLLAAGMAADNASAQCHDGFHNNYFGGAPSRYLNFKVDGRAFVFDRVSSGIFCDGVKIGVREPSGKVTLFGNVPPASGVAVAPGGVAAGGPVAAGAPVAGGPAPAGGVAIAGNPAGGAVAGVAGAGRPVGNAGGPIGAPAGNGVVAPGSAPARAGAAPGGAAAPAPAPAAAGAIPGGSVPAVVPSLGSGNDPLAAAAQPALPPVDISLLAGQWRAETKDIAGRVVVRELSFDEERNATLRVQIQGEEPISIEGPFDMTNNQFVVTDGDDKRDLGQFTVVEKDRLVLKGEGETVNFTRVEEAPADSE